MFLAIFKCQIFEDQSHSIPRSYFVMYILLLLLLYTIKYVKFNINRKMALLVSKYYVLFLKLYSIFIFLFRDEKDCEKQVLLTNIFIFIYHRHCAKLLFIATPNVLVHLELIC